MFVRMLFGLALAILLSSLSSGLPAFCLPAASSDILFQAQSPLGTTLKMPVHHWSLSGREPQAIVVAIHGLVFDGRAYDTLARHMVERGYDVYSFDMRGFGDWRAEETAAHFTDSKEDLTRLLKSLRAEYPDKPIFCMGESFGANYAMWEASTEPNLIDGAIASGLSYKICWNPRYIWVPIFFRCLAHPKSAVDLRQILEPIMSEDKTVAQDCFTDPSACINQLKPSELIKAWVTNKWALDRLDKVPDDMPILLIAGERDRIQKTKTLYSLLSRVGSKKTQLTILAGKGHLLLERRHLDSEVTGILDDWLSKQSAAKLDHSRKAATTASSQ